MKTKFDKTLLLVLGLLLLNTFSYFWLPFKLDLTQRRAFTLSPSTTKIIKDLDDVVNIKVFASANLPPNYLQIKQNLKDLLQEYQWLGGSKIKVSWIYPDKDAAMAQQAQTLGIPQVQFSSLTQDKYQVSQGFFGVSIFFEDKKEVIPFVQTTANLEYELTSSLVKISQKKQPVIGLTSGHGEIWEKPNQSPQGPLVNQVLGQEFLLENYNLASGSSTPVPDQFDALIIAGPTNYFDAANQQVLDQFLTKGKPILFFLNSVEVSNNLQATPATHNLYDLLAKYGVKLQKNLVLDSSAAVANFSAGPSSFVVPYPYWVKILPEGINQNHPATFGLQGLVLLWASSLEFSPDDKRIMPLVSSSSKSWAVSEKFNLDPSQKWQPGNLKAQTLGVVFNGEQDGKAVKFSVVGDSELLAENVSGQFAPNWHLLLNLTEFLTSSQNLAQIQVKGDDLRPLAETSGQAKETIKYLAILGLPFLIGLIGTAYLYWHSKQKFALET